MLCIGPCDLSSLPFPLTVSCSIRFANPGMMSGESPAMPGSRLRLFFHKPCPLEFPERPDEEPPVINFYSIFRNSVAAGLLDGRRDNSGVLPSSSTLNPKPKTPNPKPFPRSFGHPVVALGGSSGSCRCGGHASRWTRRL